MAYIRNENTSIFVELPNKVIGNTVIKRKAEVIAMNYSPRNQNVTVSLLINVYAQGDNDTYGDSLSSIPGFQPYLKELRADTNSIVDANTGEVLITNMDVLLDPATFADGGILGNNRDYMNEFERFSMMAQTQSVIVNNVIIQYIQTSAAKL